MNNSPDPSQHDGEEGRPPQKQSLVDDGENCALEELASEIQRLLLLGYSFNDCAHAYGVHRVTLWRWMQRTESWSGVHSAYSVDDVVEIIRAYVPIEECGVSWGIRLIHDHLRRLGIHISRLQVREALHQIMPNLLRSRAHGCLVRRDYDVFQPMHVWHIDSHDKLARWGFRIHGGIDGATHYIVYMKVCLNKKASTIYQAYQEAVSKYGHPVVIRSDYATKHNLVEADIENARPNTYAFRKGPSVHNQRIEGFWRILREKVTNYYQNALHLLSYEEGFLVMENPLHRASLVAMFLPVIIAMVSLFIQTWNAHRVRGVYERGKFRPSHIPEVAFQAWERENKLIDPPPYLDVVMDPIPPSPNTVVGEGAIQAVEEETDHWSHNDDGGHFEESIQDLQDNIQDVEGETDHWNHNDDEGCFEEGIQDLQDEGLIKLRDMSYEIHHNRVKLIREKFKLHLALTLECQQCLELNIPMENYIHVNYSRPDLPEDRQFILSCLLETLLAVGPVP